MNFTHHVVKSYSCLRVSSHYLFNPVCHTQWQNGLCNMKEPDCHFVRGYTAKIYIQTTSLRQKKFKYFGIRNMVEYTMVIFEKFCSEILGVRILHDYDNLHTSSLVQHHRTQKNQQKAKKGHKGQHKGRIGRFWIFYSFVVFS